MWRLSFSRDGRLLATVSKGGQLRIWDVSSLPAQPTLVASLECADPQMEPTDDDGDALAGSLSCFAWCPHSTHLLTGCSDHNLKLWDARSSRCEVTFRGHGEGVSACAWLLDGEHFISAAHDKMILLWNRRGEAVQSWMAGRVTELAVSREGIVAVCAQRIRMLKLGVDPADGRPRILVEEEQTLEESDAITSVTLSRDGRHMLVTLPSAEIHAWDLSERQLLGQYRGQKQERFVIRSAFGGANECLVASGSEDSQVYLWHRHGGGLVEVIPGHAGAVNDVAWSPIEPSLFASCSDDRTVRLWG